MNQEQNADKGKTLTAVELSMKVDELISMGLVHHFGKLRVLQELFFQWNETDGSGPLVPDTDELYDGISQILLEACTAYNDAVSELADLHVEAGGNRPAEAPEEEPKWYKDALDIIKIQKASIRLLEEDKERLAAENDVLKASMRGQEGGAE